MISRPGGGSTISGSSSALANSIGLVSPGAGACEPAPLPLMARIERVAMRERTPFFCQPPRNSRTSRPTDHATICFA